uniref:Uncharacterized protein n=1 Tax=blood disease bacterium R229 TaxID=741978 RepID=G2ZVX2_9RALS|nr:hypothetical protein BDB_mp60419 [blood disease bacterium R229]
MRKHSAQHQPRNAQPTATRPVRNVGAAILTATAKHPERFIGNRALASALARAVSPTK